MIEVIGVRFKKTEKIYEVSANGLELYLQDKVVVETAKGIDYGTVVREIRLKEEQELNNLPLKKVIRKATEEDKKIVSDNKEKERQAFQICLDKIANLRLNMKLVDVELAFDRNKLIFYFTSDARVDFRELVKELAAVFRTRIELRQIGVRDEAKILNGIGMCGRSLCCATFLSDFQPVSIKMAKEQNLSLNPVKISGICGRLMCCLKYEEEVYEELNRNLPSVGDHVETKEGIGEVLSTSVLLQQVKIMIRRNNGEAPLIGVYHVDEIKLLKPKRKQHTNQKKNHQSTKENAPKEIQETSIKENITKENPIKEQSQKEWKQKNNQKNHSNKNNAGQTKQKKKSNKPYFKNNTTQKGGQS